MPSLLALVTTFQSRIVETTVLYVVVRDNQVITTMFELVMSYNLRGDLGDGSVSGAKA